MGKRSLWSLTKSLNQTGDLALFVGAGVSMGCGLPSWNELVERVVRKAWKDDPDFALLLLKDRNVLAARYVRKEAKGSFNRLVHGGLYQDDIEISRCIWAIVRSGIRQVCNFNFDDLLVEAFLTDGLDCVIASPDEPFKSTPDSTTIYHPHGVLPRFYRGTELDANKIVFSEDDYHNLYSDPYSWANVAQLSLLTSKTVLFIGLSMQDPNLRRLIDIARSRGFQNQHVAVFLDPTVGRKKADLDEYANLRKLIEVDMKSLGITAWFVDSHERVADIIENLSVKKSVA